MKIDKNNYAVIMAGGIGSRFWPMSKTTCPKQFIDILGTGKTLIQQTFNRLKRVCPAENILIVTNTNYKELQIVNKQNLDQGFISEDQFLEGQEALNDMYNQVGMFSSSDISILPILQTNMTFSYARYIQGSNRLLKDVIRSAGKIVKLDGFFNTDKKVMNRYNTLLDFFVNEYNQELLKVFSKEEIQKNGYALSRDGSAINGGFNLAGTINTANTYSGASDAVNNMDLNNELEGFLPKNVLEDIL